MNTREMDMNDIVEYACGRLTFLQVLLENRCVTGNLTVKESDTLRMAASYLERARTLLENVTLDGEAEE